MRFVNNEWMKLWSKKSTWVMAILAALLVIGPAVFITSVEDPIADNWKETLQTDITSYENVLNDENSIMDTATQQFYADQILIAQYQIDNDLAPQLSTLDTFMSSQLDVARIFATLFAVIVGAGIVSSEFSTGTIKMLLTRPVKRWKILLSKLVTTVFFGLSLYVFILVFSLVVGAIFFGTETSYALQVIDGQVGQGEPWKLIGEELALSFGDFFMSIFLAFMIGTIFRSSSLAIGFTLFISFMSSTIVMLLSRYDFVKYIWIANSDLTQYVSGRTPLLDGLTLSFSLTICAIYAVVFLSITFITFIKRDVTA